MATVTVKLFGVLRMDTHLAKETVEIEKIIDLFPSLNAQVDKVFAENKEKDPALQRPDPLAYKHTVIFINGERCKNKNQKLQDGDEVWLLSPASGG